MSSTCGRRSIEDACFTFARPAYRGVLRSADEVHSMSLANLDEACCRVMSTEDVLAAGLTQARRSAT
jgi:hypothetical protein